MSSAPSVTVSAERYLRASPVGVHLWLGHGIPSLERALMLHVLAHPGGCPVAPPTMAAALGEPTQVIAKTLFALTRTGALLVVPGLPVAASGTHWDGLRQHLETLALSAGGTPAVLADPSGLCIVSHCASDTDSQQLAATPDRLGQTSSWVLYPDHGTAPFVLASCAPIDQSEPAWVSLAQCLVGMLRPHRPWRHTEPDHAP